MKLPTKKILWIQVFAALFAGIIAIVCLFTPMVTLKATSNVNQLFSHYLAAAGTSDVDVDEYYELLDESIDDEGNFTEIEVKISPLGMAFNLINTGKLFLSIISIEAGESITGQEVNFKELNKSSFGLAYYLASFMFGNALDTVEGAMEGSNNIVGIMLNLYSNLIILLVVLVLFIVAFVKAIILLIGMFSHFSAPENYYETANKRAAGLLSTLLFAMLLNISFSNGGTLVAGGIILIIATVIVLGLNVFASYAKKNSPAQLKYLITSHVVGVISLLGIALAYIGSTAAGVGNILTSNDTMLHILETAADQSTMATNFLLATFVGVIAKLLNISLISYLISVLVNCTMFTESKKKSNPKLQAVMTILITVVPYVLAVAVIGVKIPVGMLVMAWLGAIIFAVAQFGREFAYNKFTNITIAEKALLLAGYPDGKSSTDSVDAPVAEVPTEQELAQQVVATEEIPAGDGEIPTND